MNGHAHRGAACRRTARRWSNRAATSTRPTLGNEHVQCNAAGEVVLRLKRPWRDGAMQIVSPLEFLQRLATLVPYQPCASLCGPLAVERRLCGGRIARPVVPLWSTPAGGCWLATSRYEIRSRRWASRGLLPGSTKWGCDVARQVQPDVGPTPACSEGTLKGLALCITVHDRGAKGQADSVRTSMKSTICDCRKSY